MISCERVAKLLEHPGNLGITRQSLDASQCSRWPQVGRAEEYPGQIIVLMLVCVHDLTVSSERTAQMRELDDLGSGASDDGDVAAVHYSRCPAVTAAADRGRTAWRSSMRLVFSHSVRPRSRRNSAIQQA